MQTYGKSTFEHQGEQFSLSVESDDSSETPWDHFDGHGEVSEWTTRDKKPGEFVLIKDRRASRFYDFAGAMKKARAEQWGSAGDGACRTVGEKALRAVMADFERMRAWCNDEWQYVGIVVTLLDADGEPTEFTDSLWMMESDDEASIREMALQCASECIYTAQQLKALQ